MKEQGYDPKKIEKKWQKYWESKKLFQAKDGGKKKYYALVEFPYPSGDGLHVGHPRPYIGLDIIARKRRMEGYNVLYPMGWDAFGLPTENYAIKTGIQPAIVTKKNSDNFRRQIKLLGTSFDWSREINTTDPAYYKWTQWIFLQFFKQGLAYKAKAKINWCPSCKIGLANEEVLASENKDAPGKCERCGSAVEEREKEQWMLGITKYADRLDKDLDLVDYPERVKTSQRNWIGRKEGWEIGFRRVASKASEANEAIQIFTTRPETIYGATFIAKAGKQDKFTGEYAINPATNEKIPIWEAEYVMEGVGSGAIMGVPAADDRDKVFAEKYNLPIKNFDLISIEDVFAKTGAKKVTTYKLRDWVFSRQRYWGEPIPLIYCESCNHAKAGQGWQAVPEKDLPVKLPKVKDFKPTENGDSPLAKADKWIKVKCPKCKAWARRETDVMPNWAGSSWYYLRYADPKNKKSFADFKKLKYWQPVDWYNGGMEHTTLHLLYSRFWHKFLYDQKLVPGREPYQKRTSHGFILAPDGQKMSKSRGNVINPDTMVERFGADALRLYEMFIGPFEQTASWNEDGLVGTRRFLEKVWRVSSKIKAKANNENLDSLLNQCVKKVGEDIEAMKFNTCVSQMMILANAMESEESVSLKTFETFLKIISPFAPHLAEELWNKLGHKTSITLEAWPKAQAVKEALGEVKIIIQINGKVRDEILVSPTLTQNEVSDLAQKREVASKWLAGKAIKKTIFIPNRLINFVFDN